MNFISNQQKKIVKSNNKYKLINGCAGSNKTDTLIKCALTDLNINKRPILFITLVGSVTDEIKTRLEKYLDILQDFCFYLYFYKYNPQTLFLTHLIFFPNQISRRFYFYLL